MQSGMRYDPDRQIVDDHETGVLMEQVTVIEQSGTASLKPNDPPRLAQKVTEF